MKLKKIQRPKVEIKYVGVKGFFAALYAICKVGIKKTHIDYQIKLSAAQRHGIEGGTVKRHYFYIIPKYKFKRVSEISEEKTMQIFDDILKMLKAAFILLATVITFVFLVITTPLWIVPYLIYKKVKQRSNNNENE